MAEISFKPIVTVEATMTLTEGELRVFDALVGYGADAFLKLFYEHMGQAYLKPHEADLRSLFKKMAGVCGEPLRHVDQTRKDLEKAIRDRVVAKRAVAEKVS